MTKNIFAAFKFLFLYSLFISLAFAGDSAKIVSGANRLFNAGKYDEALKSYNEALISNPDSYAINYNIGTAYFKKGDYEMAISSFEKATLCSDKTLESKANYNIGNSKYKLGKLKENTELTNTVKLLREALDYYKRAIELDSNDKDAKINHELVEKELKILLDKLKQQQENKEKGQNEKQEQKNKQQSENKSANQAQEQKNQEENQAEAQKQDNETKAKEEQSQDETKETQMNKTQEENKEQTGGFNETASMPQQNESQEMSEQEAKMLLDGYRQEENAKGEIKDTTRGYPADVLKDW